MELLFPTNSNSWQKTRGSQKLYCDMETEGAMGENQPVIYWSGLLGCSLENADTDGGDQSRKGRALPLEDTDYSRGVYAKQS